MGNGNRICVEIDPEIWRKIAILAASERKLKKEVVGEALKLILDYKKQKEDEENGNSG
ncbi:hypothetical protein MHLNE_09050 [Moorella humiferrea]|uniref:hypothetical protein n=1 Tax=Neomoorella humiferrea TaxID=676965 RepID=UPI0030D17F6A